MIYAWWVNSWIWCRLRYGFSWDCCWLRSSGDLWLSILGCRLDCGILIDISGSISLCSIYPNLYYYHYDPSISMIYSCSYLGQFGCISGRLLSWVSASTDLFIIIYIVSRFVSMYLGSSICRGIQVNKNLMQSALFYFLFFLLGLLCWFISPNCRPLWKELKNSLRSVILSEGLCFCKASTGLYFWALLHCICCFF